MHQLHQPISWPVVTRGSWKIFQKKVVQNCQYVSKEDKQQKYSKKVPLMQSNLFNIYTR